MKNTEWKLTGETTLHGKTLGEDYRSNVFELKIREPIRTLGIPVVLLEGIEDSVAEAAHNAKNYQDHFGITLPLIIQVFISKIHIEEDNLDGSKKFDEIDQVQNGSLSVPGQSFRGTQNPMRSFHHGWGYFMVERVVECPEPSTDNPHYLIRIFVYKEGKDD